jgi:hypothetical protein
MRKDGKEFSFDLSLAENSSEFVLVPGGWKRDHCAICHWERFESDDAATALDSATAKIGSAPNATRNSLLETSLALPTQISPDALGVPTHRRSGIAGMGRSSSAEAAAKAIAA